MRKLNSLVAAVFVSLISSSMGAEGKGVDELPGQQSWIAKALSQPKTADDYIKVCRGIGGNEHRDKEGQVTGCNVR